jgi:thioredoxin reductase
MISGVREYVEINDRGLVIITKEGKKLELEADTVIPALPLQPNTDLFEKLKNIASEIHNVGDCNAPGLIVDAIGSAFLAAREV